METETHKCRFTLQIDAAVDEHAFAAPSFRYRFLDGSKKQTPVLGASSGWTPLVLSEGDGNRDLEAGPALSSQSPSLLLTSPPHNTLRYEHVFADIGVTDAFACALDDDPVLSFFFADHAGLAATTGGGGAAAPAPPAPAKDAKGGAAAGSKSGAAVPAPGDSSAGTSEAKPRAYAGLYELDVSSLLAGHVLVEQCWTSHRAPSDNDNNNNNSSDDSDSHAPLSVFASKKASASSPSASLFAMLPPEATGLSYLAIRVSVDQPLLSATLAKKLNPLTLTLSSIRRLPGTTSRTGTSPHTALRQYCRPVYASFQLFRDKLRAPQPGVSGGISSLALPRRLVATPGKLQDANIDWHHRVTFLSARFDRAELLDALQYATLAVEVHDRDLVQADALRKLMVKWDALHTTGIDITAPSSTSHSITAGGAEQHGVSSGNASRTTTPRTGASHPPPPQQQQQAKPLDIFAVDEVARRDCHRLLLRASELFPHGLATFRLDELLNSAKQLVGSSGSATPTRPPQPFMAYKLTTDVVAMKRRAKPLGARASSDDDDGNDPLAVFDLTPTEKLVREPGAYLASGTTLSLHVALQHPLNPIAATAGAVTAPPRRASLALAAASHSPDDTVPPLPSFSRMVLIIPYKDTRTLHQVTRVMTSVNLAALPGVPLRSYQMTEHEKLACARGQLDVITGTQIIDSQFRTIVLEGLADRGMQRVHEQIPRPAALNDPHGMRMCANDRIRFTERLYTAFEVDLKRIKLRHALPVLLTSPDIYMRTKVSEQCFQALTRLADVRHASCLDDVKRLDLFPTAAMLIEVESKYGESITLEDIHGVGHGHVSKSGGQHRQDVPDPIDVTAPETSTDTATNSSNNNNSSSSGSATKTSTSKRHGMTLKAPTDATNDAFEQLRKSRKDKDFLAARKQELDAVRCEYAEKKRLADALLQSQPAAPVYMYSGQKLRTQDALQDEMRKRLAKDHRATYTYSHEFQSLAVSLVDPDALRQTEELASRKQWTTQRGFVYPPPRQPSEYYKHKDAPSLARCEDLREPFVDNANHPQPVSRGSDDSDSSGSRRRSGALPAFSTLPSKDMVFGGTNADGSVNTEYFRSVHLCGEGLRQEQDEALKRELAEWERRLVVDKSQLKFLAHGNITSVPRKKPTQLGKIADLLHGPVRSKPLRIVKNATLPSGKRVPLEAPPVTIHNQQEYAGSVATQFASTLRATDAAQFIGPTSAVTGKPQDFVFPSMTHVLTPPVKQHVSRKEIAPVALAEKTGPLWRND